MKEDISIIDSLDFSLGTTTVQESEKLSALQNHYIREIKDFGVDNIYFSGEFPSVYFKKVKNFVEDSQKEILTIHKKIWNQGKIPFLYVESPHEVRVYNCYEKPVSYEQEDRTIHDIELYRTALNDLKELKDVFGKIAIETGSFWKEKKYANKVKNECRVEEELIKNLKKTRTLLKEEKLPLSVIHNLLLRSLFILYLEDRGATDATFYKKTTHLEDGISYFEILKSKEGAYLLFEELEDKFNGNLSPISKEEKALVTEEHLLRIKECFWSEIRRDGQLRLFEDWRLFNFEIIPIQLLSQIYEEFLGAEDPSGKAKAGAFYTPHPLAEFVLNEVLPYPTSKDTRYNIKTLDPTCGSGIFLVETLNRLLDRWEMAHPKKQLDFDTICNIVTENIFGIEINPEAIKVAAFSIYLAMLNRLNPKTLWQLRKFPYLIFDPKTEKEEKQGNNLFLMSSLSKSPMEDVQLVIGNPPFSRGGLGKEEQDYLDKRGYASELVLAFLDRVTTLAPKAKYGLICGSKPVLFNNGLKYQNFRKFLFNETYVDKVFNFSVLRRAIKKEGGRNLFASAISPISVIFYSKETPKDGSEKLMYCAPKTTIKNRIIDGIAIDKTDVNYLPRAECQKPDTKIWKIAMWGTERDFILLGRIGNKPSLYFEFQKEKYSNWSFGNGYQTSNPNDKEDKEISLLPTLQTKYIEKFYSSKENLTETPLKFRRYGNKATYYAPHIVLKKGLKKNEVCATFLDYDCAFRDGCYGIKTNEEHVNELKLLTAYFNSSFVTYLLFLNISSLGVEREPIMFEEYLQLPDILNTSSTFQKNKIIKIVNELIILEKDFFLKPNLKKLKLLDELNKLIYSVFDLSNTEIIFIESFLKSELSILLKKTKSEAFFPNESSDSKLYSKYLCKTINEFLDYDEELTVWATVFDISARIPLNVIILYFNKDKKADVVFESSENEVGQILKQMEEYSYKEYAESIYYRRFFRYSKNDKIYIIKPNEKRFWTRSMAINDADEIIAEVLNP